MPYAVYHGDHVWGLGYTPNSAMLDAKQTVEIFNKNPASFDASYRKRVTGMYLLYINRTLFEKINNRGGHKAAKKFGLVKFKKERMYKEFN